MSYSPVTIGVTLGDPSGVGPELCAALIASQGSSRSVRTVFFADRSVLERAHILVTGEALPAATTVVDRGLLSPDQAPPGRPTEAGAYAQAGYLEAAARAALRGDIDAIVTGPVSKSQCQRAGLDIPGQTEFFQRRLRADRVAMMFCSPELNVVLATTHIPLPDVRAHLTGERLAEVIDLAITALCRDLGQDRPRIGVLALNPHAGESGLLGHDEVTVIEPAMRAARERWPDVTLEGPLVPDVAFRPDRRARFDLFVAMYHDQALIPLKLLDFDHTVNVTIGLPVVRTSPDHGVAYDIAGTGAARPDSFLTAFHRAVAMASRRQAASTHPPAGRA